jgi:hypothetical protein
MHDVVADVASIGTARYVASTNSLLLASAPAGM